MGLFYGSSSGSTEKSAELLQDEFGVDCVKNHDDSSDGINAIYQPTNPFFFCIPFR